MAGLDLDLVRHALQVAREHNLAEVEIGLDAASFKARLDPAQPKKTSAPKKAGVSSEMTVSSNGEPEFKLIKSPIVGYYRPGNKPLEAGQKVNKGDVVAIVNALGIANDVESKVSGEIAEVLVTDGQPVEFGQVLAKVKA